MGNIAATSPSALLHNLKEDLLSQGLPIDGSLWPGMSISEAAASSIVGSLVKKWVYDSTEKADQAALEKFLRSNELCKNWTLPSQIDSKTEMLLNGFKQAVYSFWSLRRWPHVLVDDLRDVFEHARVGPGAAVGATGGSFYHKLFSSPLTCSDPSLYFWYKYCIRRQPEWSSAELIRQENYGSVRTVRGSKLSFVPKNEEISRCICVEPTLNIFFQLGLGAILERRLKSRFNIDISNQQFKNRDLARLGSITDGLSTIDLSSASDSISMKMLEWCLPSDFFGLLKKLRSPSVEVKGLGTVDLHMISTMGNGYTFPLETMIFACAVVACLHFRGIPENRNRSDSLWGVFGDDIICPSSVTEDVIHLLALLGFRVNDDKTFVQGPFRESCGSDFYRGSDIRGVYLKKLNSSSDFYTAINLLIRFETKTGISLEKLIGHLISELRKRLGGRRPLLVPPWENVDSGIQVPKSVAYRYMRCLKPNHWYYTALRPRVPKIRVLLEQIVVPRSAKKLIFNAPGVHMSYLQGSIQNGVIGIRTDTVNHVPERRVTTMWHEIGCPSRDTEYYGLDWGRWETTVEGLISLAMD